tara:strand:- start:689 stop:1897 length:1209 start_codon:yes stop_codon:yes gene_type:complete
MTLNKKVINRVLLCTSPIQAINARVAMDEIKINYINYKDYILIIHPLLLANTKKTIYELGKSLSYDGVYDLADQLEIIKSNMEKRIDFYKKRHFKIKNLIKSNIGEVDEIYSRINYSKYEVLVARCISGKQKYYGIEDGIGDYKPKFWNFVNRDERKTIIRKIPGKTFRLITNLLFLIYVNIVYKYKKDGVFFSKPWGYSFDKCFSNLKLSDRNCVGSSFKTAITKLYTEKPIYKKRRVIIFGSILFNIYEKLDPSSNLVSDDRPSGHFKGNIPNLTIMKRLVIIYNDLISEIISKHNVNQSEIWYKHHPRLPKDFWAYFEKHLNCEIFSYNNNQPAEIELNNRYLKAVYSVGSSALLYAKTIFNIDSYFIDMRNEKILLKPFHSERDYNIFKKYDVKIVKV